MNLRQIEVFRAVMDAGSVTDAARLLHVSQPGISRMLRHLELRLGVALFQRTRGRLLATPEALALHAEIGKVYGGVKAVQDFAAGLRTGAHVVLRVATTASLGLEVVPQAVTRLLAAHPATRVALDVLTLARLAEVLLAEQADVGVSALPLDHPGLELRPVSQWRMVLVAPAGHALAAEDRAVRVREALSHPLVAFAPDTVQGRIVDGWYSRERLPRNVAVEVRTAHMACAMVACGVGVALVDDLTARACASSRLVVRPLGEAPAFPVFTVHGRHRPASLPVQRFCAALAAVLPPPEATARAGRSRGRSSPRPRRA